MDRCLSSRFLTIRSVNLERNDRLDIDRSVAGEIVWITLLLQEQTDDEFVESRGERASGQRCIDNVGNGRCKYRQAFLEYGGWDWIEITLLVRTRIDETHYFIDRSWVERCQTGR